jgi:hypothetical protein
MTGRLNGITVGLLLILGSGCSHAPPRAADPVVAEANRPVQVHVSNNHGYPVEIFALASQTSYKMGNVLPGQVGKFTLRPGMVGHGPVEIVARGGRGEQPARSGTWMLNPGDTLDFDISNHMLNSMATIRMPGRSRAG